MDIKLTKDYQSPNRFTGKLEPSQTIWLVGGLFLIGLTALIGYRTILFPPAGELFYPWASDTLGHLLKVEYLADNFDKEVFYPKLLPDWYMGMQFLRYYPPLPYIILLGLEFLTSNTIAAGNWFILLCALVGGFSWLLFWRWIGILPAILGGILFMFIPDNMRVSLAEGNLPRVLAIALLPIVIYLLLRSIEESKPIWYQVGLALSFTLVVLSHAMMAAIYAVCCLFILALLWLKRTVAIKPVVHALGFIMLGILLSGWWLLPSMVGGITGINASAMARSLTILPFNNFLNAWLRKGNPEAYYIGFALLALTIASLWVNKEKREYSIAFTLTGCLGVVITTTGFNQFFNALPLSYLFWPVRFLGIASFCLLLALMWSLASWRKISWIAAVMVVGVVALDGIGSMFLVDLHEPNHDVEQSAKRMALTHGWREATLDLSLLGSEPSYAFTALGKREQIFGWAYQGASTAGTVAALNEALEKGYSNYLIDRLNLFGTDDVVLLNALPYAERYADQLEHNGFLNVYSGQELELFHREGKPRGFIAKWRALGIGSSAQNLSYIFPGLILGTSEKIDDYALEHLMRFDTLVLSGFDWHDRETAERLVMQAARNGVKVVVDLSGVKRDPLARIPRFLDVWGESVILSNEPVEVFSKERTYRLEPFGNESQLWHTHMLQGLDQEFWSFNYLGENAALVGYKSFGQGKVWFVGLNLPYHALQTGDPLAIQLLSLMLDLEPGGIADYSQIPLYGYEAGPVGYRFAYSLDNSQTMFIPIAYHDGMYVLVDGVPVATYTYERLLLFEAPAGEHSVQIGARNTPVYLAGRIVSGLSILALVGIIYIQKTKKDVE